MRFGILLMAFLALIGADGAHAQDTPPAAPAPGGGIVEIEIGNLSAPETAVAWLSNEVQSFMAAHPEIRVTVTSFTEPERIGFPLLMSPPMGANIIGLDSMSGYEAPYCAEKGLIVPIDGFLPDPDFSFDLFYDNYWDCVRYDGKIWGVPWLAYTDLLVCDVPIFEAAGIKTPPATWEELFDLAGQLTKDTNGDKQPEQWGLRVSTKDNSLVGVLISSILQKGARLMRDGQFDLTDPALLDGPKYILKTATQSGKVKTDPRPLTEVLKDPVAKYAMHIVRGHQLGENLKNPRLMLAPLPTFGPQVTMCQWRLYLAVRKSTPEKERASWQFLKWISRKDVSMPAVLEGYPCRKDFVEREDFKALAVTGAKNLETLYTATAWGVDYGEQVINRSAAMDHIGSALLPLVLGVSTPEILIPKAQAEANAMLQPIPSSEKASPLELYK